MFRTLLELQPRDAGSGEGAASPQEVAFNQTNDILEKFGEKKFDIEEIIRYDWHSQEQETWPGI
jgi:dynein heavy chain